MEIQKFNFYKIYFLLKIFFGYGTNFLELLKIVDFKKECLIIATWFQWNR